MAEHEPARLPTELGPEEHTPKPADAELSEEQLDELAGGLITLRKAGETPLEY